MDNSMARLRAYQISQFFSPDDRPTQQECDEFAEHATGQKSTPTLVQGGSSYTVVTGNFVIQFRAPNAGLDLEFLRHVEQAYQGFMPSHSDLGRFKGLWVYKMRNVGGVSFYLARDSLYANGCLLLLQTISDFARFFASPWHNTPKTTPLPDRHLLLTKYTTQLSHLSSGFPARFHPILNRLIPRLPDILSEDWPLVSNHIDLLENNIHADPATGKLTGICDWADAEIRPFGMSLGGVENILGIPKWVKETGRTDHVYHANHRELRGLFYQELYEAMGDVLDRDRERVETARLVGLFLGNAWRYDGDGKQLPAGEEEHGLQYVDAVLRGTCDGYCM
ncbi:uncharacterized protein C8A04DRAFT_14139 [Dichotomopilus funicola]|uniref:Aminoglycoside phosphotransferase domain-containing protein n=1 Tax=Dichotomopilus funicola TaxID=1934379 RepID=A0AAN6UY74_9PEZI|nr:hypothetical protein C8A04DRAFT_14139 [Dichotomopilus funicola]